MACRHYNAPHVRSVTTIGCANRQCVRPHFLVGQAMRADNGSVCKIPLELLHFHERGQLKVNDRYIGSVSGDGLPEFIHIAGQMHHTEMVIKRFRQHFRSFAVALRDNYTQRFHETLPH